MICPSCGKEIADGKKFCKYCGAKIAAAEEMPKKVAETTDFVHWNIEPGQLAFKIDEQDLNNYAETKGFIVQDGTNALFFADGAFAGELTGGKYAFKELGAAQVQEATGIRKIGRKIASFFTGKNYDKIINANTIVIVIVREAAFPLVYSIKDVPTAGIRSEVGIYFEASIRNIIQFYKTLLLDKKMVSFESFGATILPAVQTIIEETLTGADPVTISANAQLRQSVLEKLQASIGELYSFIQVNRVVRLTASTPELEQIHIMQEELYISEKELVELTKRNDFLNRLNSEKNNQLLKEAQSAADFVAAMNKIDEQNQLTEDEKAKFADMLYWQRKLREAQSADEGNAALNKLEQNGILRAEELEILKSDVEQRKKLKDLTDGQALAMLTLQNNMALDAQKLQWEMEIGNKRHENEINQRRMDDQYTDERRRAEMALDKEELQNSMEAMRMMDAMENEKAEAELRRKIQAEDSEHRRKMEELAHERAAKKDELEHEEAMRRMFQNMSAEQIMAANPDISPAAAAAFAEKYKSANAQAQVDMANKHSEDIERLMSANAAQQNAVMQQMMAMMGQVMGAQNNKKEAEIEAIRKDANEHQDRMTEIIKTQANAAYGAAGKIFAPAAKQTGSNNSNRKDIGTICPHCNAQVEVGASFCDECGESL